MRKTLNDIKREARALEFDVSTRGGYLDITKRGDATRFYSSIQPANDQRTIDDAWNWLQDQRGSMAVFDQARSDLARRRSRDQRRYVTQVWIQALLVIGVLVIGTMTGYLNIFVSVAIGLAVLGLSTYFTARRPLQ